MYFNEKNNFVEDSFSARPLLFAMIEIIGLIWYSLGIYLSLSRKVVDSWDWIQSVCYDTNNNFVESDLIVKILLFNIINIIGLIDSRSLVIVPKIEPFQGYISPRLRVLLAYQRYPPAPGYY